MSIIIKKTILLNSNIVTNINLNSDYIQYGDDQGIETLSNLKKEELINPVNDVELIKFKYEDTKTQYGGAFKHFLSFAFNEIDPINIAPASFRNIFTDKEISGNTKTFQNSFFILDFFDTKNIYSQKKLSTNYITKKQNAPYSFYLLNNYDVDDIKVPVNQTNSIQIPEYFLNSTTGNTLNCYCRMMFYNAKSGTTTTFFNNAKINATDSSKLFFDIEINKSEKTWKFINQTVLAGINPMVSVMAIEPNKNNLYSKRINDGVENFNNKIENYPTGTTFNYDQINYI